MPNISEQAEMLTVYDEKLNPIGTRTREEVHENGLLHQTIRLWCIQGDTIWFQQRSQNKKLFPGKLDLAATGHIDPGETPLQACLRETSEEIGLELKPDDLIQIGAIPFPFTRPDGKLDNEFTNLYLYKTDKTPDFKLTDEVQAMQPIKLSDYERMLKSKSDMFCCPNKQEWRLVKQAGGISTQQTRTTDDMPDIETKSTSQQDLSL